MLVEQLDDEILCITVAGGTAGIGAGLPSIISGTLMGRQLLRS